MGLGHLEIRTNAARMMSSSRVFFAEERTTAVFSCQQIVRFSFTLSSVAMSHFGVFFSAIPKLFWSEYSDQPFQKCLSCEVPLVECDLHVIQKRIVANEAVMEMAVCNRCRDKQAEEMSEETRKNVTEHMMACFQKRAAELLPQTEGTHVIEVTEIEDPEEGNAMLERCLESCLMCGTAREKCHRFSLAGLCRDSEMVVQVTPVGQTPFLICETCEQGMAHLVSKKTRDAWDRFVEEHFDGPPGVELDSPSHYPMAF